VSGRLDARALRDLVLDPGSWTSWDSDVPRRDVDPDYAKDLEMARERTRQDEAVVTGEGTLRGGGSPSSPGNSGSWPARSGWTRPSG
jgi:acyl-CoA carboxylase subunit beta